MKRTVSIILAMVTIASTLCACNGNKQDESNNSKVQTITVSEVTRDIDALKSKIDSYENMISTGEFKIVIPDIEEVYTFSTGLTEQQDFQAKYAQFCQLFEALHGDYKMNEDYLFYIGNYTDSYMEFTDYPTVKDNFDNLNSGNESCNSLFYDEAWYRDMTEWTSPVSLGVGKTMEYDTVTFNKGKAVYLGGKKDGIYPSLEYCSAFDLYNSFEYIGTYSPDSTETFNLSDKETPVCDAVEFYESYINSLPYSTEPAIQMKVMEVDVLAIYMIIISMVIYFCKLIHIQSFGLLAVVFVIAGGVVTCSLKSQLMWLFPFGRGY